jgi:Fe-S-cluster formation regulator IscX/YfhJ
MNISKIFPKSRKQLIESLEFSFFLYDISISLGIKYSKVKNPSIKFFLKVVSWWRNWEFNQVEEYQQLLVDYPYWESRQYYCQRIEKFLSNELSILDFIAEVLYPSLSNKREASDLLKDFQRQTSIDLDPKSFGFSKIISGLIPVLEGFDEDPEESFFTNEEFREIIENVSIKLEKYSIK